MKKLCMCALFVYPTLFFLILTHLWTTHFKSTESSVRQLRTGYYMMQQGRDLDFRYDAMEPEMKAFGEPDQLEEQFLTLFTSFDPKNENLYIYNNTFHGWMLMKPKVYLVLFSDDPSLREYAKSVGWDLTLKVGLKACENMPVLKDMFKTVQEHVKSKFYAYANADILFNQGMLDTLEGLTKNPELINKPFLISGKRSDIRLDNHNITHIRSQTQLNNVFRKSLVSYGYAEDYFIVNNQFPWRIYPNLVIGRPMVDNYLAYISRRNKVNVIDASSTIGALHQKTESRIKSKSNCNARILGFLYIHEKIVKGNVECFPYETRFDFDGSVFIMKREAFTTDC